MTPYITNLFAENRYNERNLAADRGTARARQLRAPSAAEIDDMRADVVSMRRPVVVVRRPHWWSHVESGAPVGVGSDCDDDQVRRSA